MICILVSPITFTPYPLYHIWCDSYNLRAYVQNVPVNALQLSMYVRMYIICLILDSRNVIITHTYICTWNVPLFMYRIVSNVCTTYPVYHISCVLPIPCTAYPMYHISPVPHVYPVYHLSHVHMNVPHTYLSVYPEMYIQNVCTYVHIERITTVVLLLLYPYVLRTYVRTCIRTCVRTLCVLFVHTYVGMFVGFFLTHPYYSCMYVHIRMYL